MLDWLGAPTWHFARSILNTTPGYSNSRSLGPDFEIDGSGGIGARPRLGGGAELLPHCHGAARRPQRGDGGALVLATASGGGRACAARRSSVGGGRRWRCGRRDGGGAPGWQRDAAHIESDGQRRRAEALRSRDRLPVAGGLRGGASRGGRSRGGKAERPATFYAARKAQNHRMAQPFRRCVCPALRGSRACTIY